MPDARYDIDATLVDALARPEAFDHPADEIERIETHISWLILAGDYAYKIKKPIVLDFLDFGDLDKRRHFCEEELRLNGHWAPALYLDVVPVTVSAGQPRFGGEGEPVEYAVKMRRFSQARRLDRQLEDNALETGDMRELAEHIAGRHAESPRVPAGDRTRVLRLTRQFIDDNFEALQDSIAAEALQSLRDWSDAEYARLEPDIARRFDEGRFRDCHGDLHLGNLVRLDTGITAFDCIEFNRDLRSIDVFCDIAFLTMDLVARGRRDLAFLFLNRYLERSGDYDGMAMHDLFLVYRCLVRAKVDAIRAEEEADEPETREAALREASRYASIAAAYAADRSPALVIMSGLSGSGKTWVAGQLMASLGAVRVRSDIERKRLAGIDETADTESPVGEGLYAPAATEAVYARLRDLAAGLLAARQRVILDAAFLEADVRKAALRVAAEAGCPAVLVRVEAPSAVLEQRLRARATAGKDASEADLAVLRHQRDTEEPPGEDEARRLVVFDNAGEPDTDRLAGEIVRRIDTEGSA